MGRPARSTSAHGVDGTVMKLAISVPGKTSSTRAIAARTVAI